MARFPTLAAAALAAPFLSAPGTTAFAPAPRFVGGGGGASTTTTTTTTTTARSVLPPDVVSGVAEDVAIGGSSMLQSMIGEDDMGQFTKSAFIVLLFGGGLIPPAIIANKSLLDTLMKKRPEKKELTDEQKKNNFDPTFGQADYIESSGATGPNLPAAPLLFAPESIPIADVAAIVGRIDGVESIADWRNLPSTRAENLINPDKPPMWLPRATFKANVRKAKFQGWPVDAAGNPIGGEDLRAAELSRVSKPNPVIGDAALDAVFDTWAWGANIATPDKVAGALRAWSDDEGNFSLAKFQLSAVSGRAVTGIGALTFVLIQALAYGALFIAPALRAFLDIDIGLGEMGMCDPEKCVHLFNL